MEKTRDLNAEFKEGEVKLEKLADAEYRKAADELRERLLKKYSFAEDDIAKFKKLGDEHSLKETLEYAEWSEGNKKLHARVGQLLEEFYKDREVPENVKILLAEHCEGNHFNIYSGKEDYDREPKKKISDKDKRELSNKLKLYRAEFKEFEEFLRRKYFE